MNALLPKRVQELIDVIGCEAALKLVENYGGTALWIPQKARQEHHLRALIGLEAFKKLTFYYADTYLEIDLCARILRAERNNRIIADSELMTDRQLARKYRTTERHIRRIRKSFGRQVHDTAQLDLFEQLFNREQD